jgi:prevent-host-death family protein
VIRTIAVRAKCLYLDWSEQPVIFMKKVQATQAKATFAELLREVERGETVLITRHGKTVARLMPETIRREEEVARAIRDLEELRASLPRTGISVEDMLEMRHEGHRY